jgi:hypothetical protein
MSTELAFCKTCRKPKAPYACGLCGDFICKSCAQFLGEDHFSFLRKIPQELTHTIYCYNCFDDKVAAPLADYNDTMEKAREVMIFTKEQSKLTRLLKRAETPYQVENCADEEEALLKMSFYAIQDKFNTLLDVSFKSKKIIIGSHKKAVWDASAVPIKINPKEVREY